MCDELWYAIDIKLVNSGDFRFQQFSADLLYNTLSHN